MKTVMKSRSDWLEYVNMDQDHENGEVGFDGQVGE
jgi:hypothetical protein